VRFTPIKLPGAWLVEIEPRRDDRGYFARAWCRHEMTAAGLNAELVQINEAVSVRQGTVRGLHYQKAPHAEVKLVRCLRGAMYDVIVDVRPDSPTYGRWFGIELTANDGRMLYVPAGFAHGYQTLCDDTWMMYQTSHVFAPESATGLPFDDPALAIHWPLPVTVVSPQDRQWPRLHSVLPEHSVTNN
jgi:dTDP-4-dehydrorhamnose 3,5-epimerase